MLVILPRNEAEAKNGVIKMKKVMALKRRKRRPSESNVLQSKNATFAENEGMSEQSALEWTTVVAPRAFIRGKV